MSGNEVAIALFTRDLRVHDNPTLHEAVRSAEAVLPLFVVDPGIADGAFGCPNRRHFLADCLDDLRSSLRRCHADLVIAEGDTVEEVAMLARRVGAGAVFVGGDASARAQRREHQLIEAGKTGGFTVRVTQSISVLPPLAVTTGSGEHYKVFTPYFRAWRARDWRALVPAPKRIAMVRGVRLGRTPARLRSASTSPRLPRGGETTGRHLWQRWRSRLEHYGADHDYLARDGTSRTSPYLHFGCLSARELAGEASERRGGDPFVRQLAWRDFFLQMTYAFPELPRVDYRAGGRRWRRDERAFRAWADARTGVPIVDAGMRQLHEEGWMHNRARLVCASYLVHDLGLDWRLGAWHFLDWLVDGDIANNSGNWQWVAGTGNNPRPNRVLNPWRQAQRFDPSGAYVERYTAH